MNMTQNFEKEQTEKPKEADENCFVEIKIFLQKIEKL